MKHVLGEGVPKTRLKQGLLIRLTAELPLLRVCKRTERSAA